MAEASDWNGLVRVTVRYQDRETSVSMDSVLFGALSKREGGMTAASTWVRAAVARVDALVDAEDPLVCVKGAGLSRQVQRLALAELLPAAGP